MINESTLPWRRWLTLMLCTAQLRLPAICSTASSTTVPMKTASARQTAAHGGVALMSQVQAAAVRPSVGASRNTAVNTQRRAVHLTATVTHFSCLPESSMFVSEEMRDAIEMPYSKDGYCRDLPQVRRLIRPGVQEVGPGWRGFRSRICGELFRSGERGLRSRNLAGAVSICCQVTRRPYRSRSGVTQRHSERTQR